MLFNSIQFLLIFLPVVLMTFNCAKQRSPRHAMVVLLVSSFVFYSWWDIRFTPMLALSILLNYSYGMFLVKNRQRRFLAFGIVLNLLPLIVFKYAGWLGGMVDVPIQSLVLPLGISFFTFLQIGYLTSAYKGTTESKGLLAYAVFVCYFPHLIAGPILRHKEVTEQLVGIPRSPILLDKTFARGALLLAVGLFKKVIVADALCAGYANETFAQARTVDFTESWTGALAYSCQLYFDFSGYCEMALGMSMMMGIVIPINFASPYRASNIGEFWRTWHMSLSSFFRDHVYIPLGGNRRGLPVQLGGIALTFALTGIWHGAGWTFLAWGCLHATYLIVFRLWSRWGVALPVTLAKIVTLGCVVFAWVLFRATTIEEALAMWRSMLGFNGFTLGIGFTQFSEYLPESVRFSDGRLVVGTELLLYGVLLGWCATAKNVHEFELKPTMTHAAGIGILGLCSMLFISKVSTFLYWSF